MLKLLKRIRNILAYGGAGLVILLAVLVGLFRLFLPRLTEYQEDIKDWATAAIGMQVEFAGMNARWRLSGPELNFYDAELSLPESGDALIRAAEVTIGVGLVRLLVDRTLIVDRVIVSGTELDFARADDGEMLVQGLAPDAIASLVPASGEGGDVVFVGEDISVRYTAPGLASDVVFRIDTIEATRRDERLAVEGSMDLGNGFGSGLDVTVDQILGTDGDVVSWHVYFEGRSLGLARWFNLLPTDLPPVVSGFGDASLWLELDAAGVSKATSNFAVSDLAVQGAARREPFDLAGRLEFSRVGDRLLLAAENLTLLTANGRWPQSSLQMQIARDDDGRFTDGSANGTYVRLDDFAYFSSWIPEAFASVFADYAPTGEVRDFRLNLADLDTGTPTFDLGVDAESVGFRPVGRLPGIRGFTGGVRADNAGGRVEFRSSGLRFTLPEYVTAPMILDDVVGTLIWRRSGERLTVLTDRLLLRSPDFDSRTSLQVTVGAEGASPVVDLESQWSINDVAAAKRFLPEPVIHPALFRWLNEALVSGSMRSGTTRLVGPLDRFPFDNGEGRFEVRARLEDAVLDYAKGWPAASIRSMDIALDGMRLATERNIAVTTGNRTVDAKVAIDDLRKPVLTIDAFANGSLETIRQFALRSPIAGVFGGRLEGVRVNGDASFNLELNYPITDRQNYDFRTRIRPSNGTVELLGFPAAVSELNGVVEITRRSISSESLFGTFLGQPVAVDLSSADPESPAYSVVARAEGRATADGLMQGLGAPLHGLVGGAADYTATLRFPQRGLDEPVPVQIAIDSDLVGLELLAPEPLAKSGTQAEALSLLIEIPEAGRIAASGSLGDGVRWRSDFFRDEYGWDFDRGALALGGDPPAAPESRGLHIEGRSEALRLSDWFRLAQNQSGDGPRFTDRIRSIDLEIGSLRLFGQNLVDHRVTVDRSGAEWFARVAGEQVSGTVTIPYELSGARPVRLDMQKLILPGDDAAGDERAEVAGMDPRRLPPISLEVEEFAFGERFLGRLSAEFEKTGNGLRAPEIRAEDPSFTIDGSAGWYLNPPAGSASRTTINATLSSRDVQETLSRLDYEPVIDSAQMTVEVDVTWPGGPRADFLDELSGEVSVRLGDGQLNEVEPGAGRVFGLMSVAELPRRLSLDFRDVFDKGFSFDEITGTFSIDRGDAYTCDLSLKGPAADIGIVGRVGLADGEYEQTALVSANVGSTLPVVGAVVAGPQVAAALLIFSQIFKKPLQEMGQVYYAIDGGLDDPLVEVADAQRFAATSERADCLARVE